MLITRAWILKPSSIYLRCESDTRNGSCKLLMIEACITAYAGGLRFQLIEPFRWKHVRKGSMKYILWHVNVMCMSHISSKHMEMLFGHVTINRSLLDRTSYLIIYENRFYCRCGYCPWIVPAIFVISNDKSGSEQLSRTRQGVDSYCKMSIKRGIQECCVWGIYSNIPSGNKKLCTS